MIQRAIADTGPLVAFLNSKDVWHTWVVERLAEIEPPLLTCESVISETCFLLRAVPRGVAAVFDLVKRGVLVLPFRLAEEATAVERFLKRYESVPMSVADACLVRMTELDARSTVLTLDSDFRIYRRHGRQAIPLVSPDR